MNRSILAVKLSVLLGSAMTWACVSHETGRADQTGRLQVALKGTSAQGVSYRLRSGTFDITGPSMVTVSTEDELDAASIEVDLKPGEYSVALVTGWSMEREAEDGTLERVAAVLTSSDSQMFTIEEAKTANVRFRFRVTDDVVELGDGTLVIGIDVDDATQSGDAGVELEPGVAMKVGQWPPPIAGGPNLTSGDLDGDGWPDIVLAHGYSTGAIVLNQHAETFAPEVVISESWWNTQNNVGASSVSLADLDLDGDLDYVFPIYGAHYTGKMIQVYEGDGHGNHTIPSQLPNGLVYTLRGANPMPTRVADFDLNGLPDIVSGSNNGAQTADIILQTSPWVFTPTYAYNQNQSANPQYIDIGDFNNDGWMDLVVPFLYGQVEVYLNTANGTGAMTYAGGYLSARHHQVAVADLNGDGFQDIAARSDPENQVDVLYNDGTGAFSATATFGVSGNSGMVRAGDIDGDGTMDLVACSYSASTVDVLLNDGTGSFQGAVPISLDEPPWAIALDDFDQDGDVDVAVYTRTNNVGDHLRVLWNRRER